VTENAGKSHWERFKTFFNASMDAKCTIAIKTIIVHVIRNEIRVLQRTGGRKLFQHINPDDIVSFERYKLLIKSYLQT